MTSGPHSFVAGEARDDTGKRARRYRVGGGCPQPARRAVVGVARRRFSGRRHGALWWAVLGLLSLVTRSCGSGGGFGSPDKPVTPVCIDTPAVPPASRGITSSVSGELSGRDTGDTGGRGAVGGGRLLRKDGSEGFKIVGEKIIGNGTPPPPSTEIQNHVGRISRIVADPGPPWRQPRGKS